MKQEVRDKLRAEYLARIITSRLNIEWDTVFENVHRFVFKKASAQGNLETDAEISERDVQAKPNNMQ